ncbi:hypothetical protein [Persicobacter diffluens]|uniref:Capsule assembly protein Wzi n=1 Tax=Persicobacter diffluens TaxID=981 RepID=A0AAN4W0D3_9BACT|nr:hypothetical protein PEDI_25490 [Persicobacter diffluens]
MKNWPTVKVLFLFFLLGIGQQSLAQEAKDSLVSEVSTVAALGTKGYLPHWLSANQYGKLNAWENDGYLRFKNTYNYSLNSDFNIELGLDMLAKQRLEESYFHQYYLKAKYKGWEFRLGRMEQALAEYGEGLTTGSYILSSNARPFEKVGFGLFDYWDVPFTKGYLQIKGAMQQGWMKQEWSYGNWRASSVHEKFAYLQIGNLPVRPYAGLNHVVMYNGVDKNGIKKKNDFWSVFWSKPDAGSGVASESTNSAGSTNGIFDFGFSFDYKDFEITVYDQKPIVDKSSFSNKFARNKDHFAGIWVRSDQKRLVSAFKYEFIKTTYQNGMGTPDPVVIDQEGNRLNSTTGNSGHLIWNNDGDAALIKKAYPLETQGMSNEEVWLWTRDTFNNGHRYGGRGDYYNHAGHNPAYAGRLLGNPLMTSSTRMDTYSGEEISLNEIARIGSANNRIIAHHVGLNGWLSDFVQYRMLVTYSENLGNWNLYGGRFTPNFTPDPDYYFYGGLTQWYTYFETVFKIPNLKQWEFTTGIAYDFGEITNNFGVNIGVRWSYGTSLIKDKKK